MTESRSAIRPAQKDDRERIQDILDATRLFTDREIGWAMELVDLSFDPERADEYVVEVLEDGGAIAGYVCYGPTPRSEGVFDLYWIAVDPSLQRRGIGSRLLRHVEERVDRLGGRLILIETWSRVAYEPTVRFYESHGYREISRIKDFYRIENDKIVFGRTLS